MVTENDIGKHVYYLRAYNGEIHKGFLNNLIGKGFQWCVIFVKKDEEKCYNLIEPIENVFKSKRDMIRYIKNISINDMICLGNNNYVHLNEMFRKIKDF